MIPVRYIVGACSLGAVMLAGVPASAQAPVRSRAQPASNLIAFDAFSEAVELATLVDFVGSTLNINIFVDGELTGSVVFNAPVQVPRSELLNLLDAMLEQYDYTITPDTAGFYKVQPLTKVKPVLVGELATTRIIPTPNVKPSTIQPALLVALGQAPGGNQPGAGSVNSSVQAIDELGVLVVTATARTIGRVQALVDELLAVKSRMEYIRIELQYVAAPAALERVLALAGGSAPNPLGQGFTGQQRNPNFQANQALLGAAGAGLTNLDDRLVVDPQGNALIFKGTQEEADEVRSLIDSIDKPSALKPRQYFGGAAASQIADIASRRGLGEVVILREDQQLGGLGQFGGFNQFNNQLNQATGQTQATLGGPVMVVDVARGAIIYYGTQEQQDQLAALLDEMGTDDDRVVVETYVLNHNDAEEVANLLTGLITGQQQTSEGGLLPQAQGRGATGGQPFQQIPPAGPAGDDEVAASFDPGVTSVFADIPNNQIIVRAPKKQQAELAKLIDRLDRRRSQVYIQAQIVAVSDNTDFRLAIESQISAGQYQQQTNFGLSEGGTSFSDPRVVSTGLEGFTSALIRSDYIPFIINAIQTDTDSRIISTPSLLVNDNEDATIVSLEQQATTTTTQGDATTETGFGGFEDAGTTLEVTPSISDGGFLRLTYRIELSNFVGDPPTPGIPADRQERTVEGQVTIPSDATIVVGGIAVDDVSTTIAKVPLLGDIPLLGHLFRRTTKNNDQAKLYIFITPRIMTDPNFYDLKLLTRGPQAEVEMEDDQLRLEPAIIETIGTRFFVAPEPPQLDPEPDAEGTGDADQAEDAA